MNICAIICFVFAAVIGIWQYTGQSESKDIRSNGQKTAAVAINRKEVQYNTPEGKITSRPLVAPSVGTLKQYEAITVYYDKHDPKRVVLARNEFAHNITLWIAVAKFLVAGFVLLYLGYRSRTKTAVLNSQAALGDL